MRFAPLLALLLACANPEVTPPPATPALDPVPSLAEPEVDRQVLSVVATNDIHGHLERLPDFGGYVHILRRLRADDGGVLLVDAGDMWQGTIASNLDEGASGVAAFGALGYDAVTIGNHEFDYGPVGERATPREGDDPVGALRARAASASFPFLTANVRLRGSEASPAWDNVRPSILLERGGVKVGLVGVTTEDTLATTIAANVRQLAIAPLAASIEAEARSLREQGAQVVIVLAHAGGECDETGETCDGEIMEVARALPAGLVDLIAAGHTHERVVAEVGGIAIVESGALSTGFARVDFVFEDGALADRVVHPIHDICAAPDRGLDDCEPGTYEGQQVTPQAPVLATVTPALERAQARIDQPLGATVAEAPLNREYREESALGDVLVDWMHALRPRADVALLNAGGVRANIGAGPITYGELYEAFPFDNQFAMVRMTVAQLRAMVAANLQTDSGVLLGSGFTVEASCRGGELQVVLKDRRGRPMNDRQRITVVTSDYLATTPAFAGVGEDAVTIEETGPMRELMADHLREHGGQVDPAAHFDPEHPRWALPSARPLRCE